MYDYPERSATFISVDVTNLTRKPSGVSPSSGKGIDQDGSKFYKGIKIGDPYLVDHRLKVSALNPTLCFPE